MTICTAFSILAGAAGLRAEAPLSAIDWLSESVSTPASAPAATPAVPDEAPVTQDALPEDVTTSVLGAPSPDALGVLSPKVTGLPAALWGDASVAEIREAIARTRTDSLPALQGLLMTLLLAESDPPSDAGNEGTLLLARIDKLLAMGALEQAQALMDMVEEPDPALFRRSFDVDLLTGNEDRGCETMTATPSLAPTLPARIFCLARAGDWNAAALTLETARALGQVTEDEDALLARFLDPELAENLDQLPPPPRMTPLDWRMYEAIGETFPTTTLPLAFAHAELRDPAGWKAQLDAAERLARSGVIDPNLLAGLYSANKAAASGGVWDRVQAFQRLDEALNAGDASAVARALPIAWSAMAAAELEVVLADLVANRVSDIPLEGDAANIALRLELLAPDYSQLVKDKVAKTPREDFLLGLATGDVADRQAPDSMARMIVPAFGSPTLSLDTLSLVAEGRTGELILLAIDRITTGVESDPSGVTEGLAILQRLGMTDTARRTALQLMLLERRG
ncbi:hypothetical protein JO391_06945 [Neotabrizicola shimadae]|uniref:Antifreeze glycopeptide polyprotein n=1 Tax=Neotabrizicola shimadae TaxID=2807096 RepID=A0A8G1EEW3_9RHOB|nr:hypothetical protein JO391_06945 [Neotabrizicola shimadae]